MFKALRSPKGEHTVLEENFFVEKLLPYRRSPHSAVRRQHVFCKLEVRVPRLAEA
jgi:hypothetical protein